MKLQRAAAWYSGVLACISKVDTRLTTCDDRRHLQLLEVILDLILMTQIDVAK